jgi:hypothetical protein
MTTSSVKTQLTWVLGEKLPRIKRSDITCHATDDVGIVALFKEAGAIILARQRVLRVRQQQRWLPAWGPELTIWVDVRLLDTPDFGDIISWIAVEGRHVGIFLAVYAQSPSSLPIELTPSQIKDAELYRTYKCQTFYHTNCFSTSHLTFDKLYDHMVRHGIGCDCWMHAVLREAKRLDDYTGLTEAEGRTW